MKTYLKGIESIDVDYELMELEFLFIQCDYGRV